MLLRWIRLLVPSGLAVALGMTAAGCGGAGTTQVVTQTLTVKRVVHPRVFVNLPPRRVIRHRTVTVHPEPVAYQLFEGSDFSIEYPTTWLRKTTETSKGAYLDTTIQSDASSDVLIRIDVTPNSSSDASASATQVEQALSKQAGYREIRFAPTTFQGYDGVAWEFVVDEHGVPLHKVDVFLDDDLGDGVAVLTQAPDDEYRQWQPVFAHMRQSLIITP
jgi:hypothetical protein